MRGCIFVCKGSEVVSGDNIGNKQTVIPSATTGAQRNVPIQVDPIDCARNRLGECTDLGIVRVAVQKRELRSDFLFFVNGPRLFLDRIQMAPIDCARNLLGKFGDLNVVAA